ncbi:unnamed protein product [Eruca vesicaria subsp. sativa]|uniref:Uncharacterized protein n=1 Tax=Eruca vesicaria subsp. sativa TaxID=29727 RepID=A0ABC8M8A3_ERUVS|nr:unnamed protein product [Eruca vesicaria subsp. sativa]
MSGTHEDQETVVHYKSQVQVLHHLDLCCDKFLSVCGLSVKSDKSFLNSGDLVVIPPWYSSKVLVGIILYYFQQSALTYSSSIFSRYVLQLCGFFLCLLSAARIT